MSPRLPIALVALAVLATGVTAPAAATDLPPRPYAERYTGGDPYARPAHRPEKYGQAWHRPHRWPEHRSKGTYVGVPVYPYWRVPAVDYEPVEAQEPSCRWERIYGSYLDKWGNVRQGWHKVPICG